MKDVRNAVFDYDMERGSLNIMSALKDVRCGMYDDDAAEKELNMYIISSLAAFCIKLHKELTATQVEVKMLQEKIKLCIIAVKEEQDA